MKKILTMMMFLSSTSIYASSPIIPAELICATWTYSTEAISCVSKASIEKDKLEARKLALEIAVLEEAKAKRDEAKVKAYIQKQKSEAKRLSKRK